MQTIINKFTRESEEPQQFQNMKPISSYTSIRQQGSQQEKSYDIKRNQIQFHHIREVNMQNSNITDLEDVSTSGSDPTFETMTSVGDEQDTCVNRTRAQKVPSSTILAPAFKNNGPSMFMRSSNLKGAVYGQQDNKDKFSLSNSPIASNLSLQINNIEKSVSEESAAQSSRSASKRPALLISTEEPPVEKKSSSPKNESAKAAAIITERQVKYLGLVIEKDEEQAIEVGEESYMPNDPVRRQYIPIREDYIRIVKNCRKLCIDSLDRRGKKDMKRTIKNLNKIARSYAKLNYSQNQFF